MTYLDPAILAVAAVTGVWQTPFAVIHLANTRRWQPGKLVLSGGQTSPCNTALIDPCKVPAAAAAAADTVFYCFSQSLLLALLGVLGKWWGFHLNTPWTLGLLLGGEVHTFAAMPAESELTWRFFFFREELTRGDVNTMLTSLFFQFIGGFHVLQNVWLTFWESFLM